MLQNQFVVVNIKILSVAKHDLDLNTDRSTDPT